MKAAIACLVAVILIALLIPVAGCGKSEKVTGAEKLQIISHSMTIGEGNKPIVTGAAKNMTSATIFAEITVNFYDASGALLGSATADTNRLASGAIWNFEVIYYGENRAEVDSYKVEIGLVF